MNPDIISIGDTTLDAFLSLNDSEAGIECLLNGDECRLELPYGSKIPLDSVDFSLGGNAPNVAVSLKRLGFEVSLYTIHGDDLVGRIVDERISQEGLGMDYVFRENGQTSYSTIINFRKERTILAMKHHRIYKIFDNFPKTSWMYISSLGPDYREFYRDISKFIDENGIKLGYNPSPIELRRDFSFYQPLVSSCHLVFLNKQEGQMMLGINQGSEILNRKRKAKNQRSKTGDQRLEIKEMLSKIHDLGPKYVIITDGINGAYAFDGDRHYYSSIFPVERIEATGAGDAFAGGFLGAIMRGKKTEEAVKWGMVNSASVVAKVGALAGLLTQSEIEKKLENNPKFSPLVI